MDDIIASYKKSFAAYTLFKGRTNLKDFLIFAVTNFLIHTSILMLGSILGVLAAIASVLFLIAIFIPSIAISVRRLHDINRSGWFMLLHLVPAIGSLVVLVMNLIPGNKGSNDFGAA